jgi:serine/threonine-protein phosphatase 2B regulatory subunit
MNRDGYITNGDLFKALQLFVDDQLDEVQIQQLVDRTIMQIDKDKDGKISYDEFVDFVKKMNMERMFSLKIIQNK